jgi:hypothetical protein
MDVMVSEIAAPQEEFPFKVSGVSEGGDVDVSVAIPIDWAVAVKKRRER